MSVESKYEIYPRAGQKILKFLKIKKIFCISPMTPDLFPRCLGHSARLWSLVIFGILLIQRQAQSTDDDVTKGRQLILDLYTNYTSPTSLSNPVDLVFVLDRSASVTRPGWQSILRFVQTFLEHFTVDADNTRVAVISYGTTASVDIDGIRAGDYNKCELVARIQKQLLKKVPSGYSATHDAIIKVKDVVLNSRRTAKKAVIVITDGKSNIGPTPVRASVQLRSLVWDKNWNTTTAGPQLQIYAFGIKDAYMPEVRTIASPLPNHTFYIPSFQTFSELARSLHNDSQSENWHVLGDNGVCSAVCSEHAHCACGTRSGHYLCVCKDGYQGDGNICAACPRGTYKNKISPSRCWPCPTNSTTLIEGATDVKQCVCEASLYQEASGQPCQARVCDDLQDIEHGQKFHVDGRVLDEVANSGEPCKNMPDTSCHYQCDLGYRFNGHPGLVCNPNGTWEGTVPTCQIVDCSTLEYHNELVDHGLISYINGTTTFDSVVRITCDKGWRAFGDTERMCTQHGTWSGTRTWCVENSCPAVPLTSGLIMTPAICGQASQLPDSECFFDCEKGFSLLGPSRVVCSEHGVWMENTATICKDVEPPSITCPGDITTPVTTANYALIHWKSSPPVYSDNSGEAFLTSIGIVDSPLRLTAGFHQIKYIVSDTSGNEAQCVQSITVVDFTVHLVSCPEDVTYHMSQHQEMVNWPEVVFADNNNVTIPHTCVPANNTLLPAGAYTVQCQPNTTSYHQVHCHFKATLRLPQCNIPAPPLHGSLSCSPTPTSLLTCVPQCNDNYDFHSLPQGTYICNLEGNWNLRKPGNFWPDCSRKYYPQRAVLRGQAKFFYYKGNCHDVREEITVKFTEFLESQAWDVCGGPTCSIEDVQVFCGAEAKRKRRSLDTIQSSKLWTNEKGEINQENLIEFFSMKEQKLFRQKRQKTDKTLSNTKTNSSNDKAGYDEEAITNDGSELDYDENEGVTRKIFHMEYETTKPDMKKSQEGGGLTKKSIVQGSASLVTEITKKFPPIEKVDLSAGRHEQEERRSVTGAPRRNDDVVRELPGLDVNVNDTRDTLYDSVLPDIDSDYDDTSYRKDSTDLSTYDGENSADGDLVTDGDRGSHVDNRAVTPDDASQLRIKFKVVSKVAAAQFQEDSQVEMIFQLSDVLYRLNETLAKPILVLGERNQTSHGNDTFILNVQEHSFKDPEIEECMTGYITHVAPIGDVKTCVACPAGSYYDDHEDICFPCHSGFYQPNEAQSSCLSCPDETTTELAGSDNISLCLAMCQPGEYSTSGGLAPCQPCPLHTFISWSSSETCILCPWNRKTLSLGSKLPTDCIDLCNPGYYSETGLVPCQQCRVGSYQPNGGSAECFLCDMGQTTLTSGAQNHSECVEIDACAVSNLTCNNNGTCVSENGEAQCLCMLGFTGINCELDTDDCDVTSCQNSGVCIDGVNRFTCSCQPGFTGFYCEVNIDECLSSPCQNGGSCLDQVNGFQCYCKNGFSGDNCEVELEQCDHNVCINGICQEGEDHQCICHKGYAGATCNVTYDLCSLHHCLNAEKCVSSPGHFMCHCLPGFTGILCETMIDFCSLSPCFGRSTCISRQGSFLCICPPGWTGSRCTQEASPDFDLVFNVLTFDGHYVAFPSHLMPSLHEFSLCAWFRPQPMSAFATIATFTQPHTPVTSNDYSTWTDDQQFGVVFALRHTDKLIVKIFDHLLPTSASLTPFVWSHLCITWQSGSGQWQVMVNGSLVSGGSLGPQQPIPEEISVIIGQQNPYHAEAAKIWDIYSGEITQFNIYGRVLSMPDLVSLANLNTCNQSNGDIIKWTDVLMYIKGDLIIREYTQCLDINECWFPEQYPCGNNRACLDMIGSYNCSECAEGFKGDDCTELEDECLDDPCENGTCIDGPEPFDYYCVCPAGITGLDCRVKIDFCESNPCQNEGTCVPLINSFSCQCPSPNMGPHCERPATACLPNPCQNHGICLERGADTFECRCSDLFTGRYCETPRNWCDENLCLNGGICVTSNLDDPQSNTVGGKVCKCQQGWMGLLCDVQIIPSCDLSPCINGGTCIPMSASVEGYTCHCPDLPGVKLDSNCGILSPCESSPCPNTTQCVSYVNFTYSCVCLSGECEPWIPVSESNSTTFKKKNTNLFLSEEWIMALIGGTTAIIIVTVFFIIYLCRKRKPTRYDLEMLNSGRDVVLGHITNPGFHHEETDAEESTYAELGDYNISNGDMERPDHPAQSDTLMSSNITRAETRKMSSASSGSFTSIRSSLSKKLSKTDETAQPLLTDEYLEPLTLKRTLVDNSNFAFRDNHGHDRALLRTGVSNPEGLRLGIPNAGFNPENYIIPDQIRKTASPVREDQQGTSTQKDSQKPDEPSYENYVSEISKTGPSPYMIMGANNSLENDKNFQVQSKVKNDNLNHREKLTFDNRYVNLKSVKTLEEQQCEAPDKNNHSQTRHLKNDHNSSYTDSVAAEGQEIKRKCVFPVDSYFIAPRFVDADRRQVRLESGVQKRTDQKDDTGENTHVSSSVTLGKPYIPFRDIWKPDGIHQENLTKVSNDLGVPDTPVSAGNDLGVPDTPVGASKDLGIPDTPASSSNHFGVPYKQELSDP
ncbi:unnamed protein product [Lymnaea stagnalis]|uniref:Sushi, von Willebrand factor type A, EGF and pentraxin domain-containing protein 1 n=1 Tax=Lymnaea stagnalis TaxID=6523 RepID=A0AAV2HLH4_LYMST